MDKCCPSLINTPVNKSILFDCLIYLFNINHIYFNKISIALLKLLLALYILPICQLILLIIEFIL